MKIYPLLFLALTEAARLTIRTFTESSAIFYMDGKEVEIVNTDNLNATESYEYSLNGKKIEVELDDGDHQLAFSVRGGAQGSFAAFLADVSVDGQRKGSTGMHGWKSKSETIEFNPLGIEWTQLSFDDSDWEQLPTDKFCDERSFGSDAKTVWHAGNCFPIIAQTMLVRFRLTVSAVADKKIKSSNFDEGQDGYIIVMRKRPGVKLANRPKPTGRVNSAVAAKEIESEPSNLYYDVSNHVSKHFRRSISMKNFEKSSSGSVGSGGAKVHNLFSFGYHATITDKSTLEAIKNDPEVQSVEKDGDCFVSAVQSNPPWGLDRIDQPCLPLDKTFDYFDEAGEGIDIYIIDTGVKVSDNEFKDRGFLGNNFVPGEDHVDLNGHGTHVASIAGGTVYGVAKKSKIWSVKTMDKDGRGSFSRMLYAIDWIVQQHKNRTSLKLSKGSVISISVNGIDQYDYIKVAIENAVAAGVPVIVGAGNSQADACGYSPSFVPAALTVASTDWNDQRSSYSSFGSCVDLFAPGDGITAISNNGARVMSGTSMATPHVTGVAAIILSRGSIPVSTFYSQIIDLSVKNLVKDPRGSPNNLLQLKASNQTCNICPAGFASNGTSCVPCPVGQFKSSTGNATCSLCPQGSYADTAGTVNCKSCPASWTTSSVGSTSIGRCNLCAPGYANNGSLCTACPLGYFKNVTGAGTCMICPPKSYAASSASRFCEPCPVTLTTLSAGSTSSSDCSICASNYTSSAVGKCDICAQGYSPWSYGQASGIKLCFGCPSGYAKPSSGNTTCTICPKGSYSDKFSSVECTPCKSGFTTLTLGSVNCTSCAAGFYSSDGNCVGCPVGTFKSATGNGTCSSCPVGTTTLSAGTVSSTNCNICAGGYYPSGASCVACPAGQFKPLAGNGTCSSCPNGLTTDSTGKCSICAAGFYSSDGNCVGCPVGEFKSAAGNGTCSSCPVGTTTLSAGTVSSANCNICAGDYYPNDHHGQCISCPKDATCPGGVSQFSCNAGFVLSGSVCLKIADESPASEKEPFPVITVASVVSAVVFCAAAVFLIRRIISKKRTENGLYRNNVASGSESMICSKTDLNNSRMPSEIHGQLVYAASNLASALRKGELNDFTYSNETGSGYALNLTPSSSHIAVHVPS